MLMTPTKIVIHGAAGRMGRSLVALVAEDPQLELVAALEAPGHPRLGDDSGQVAAVGENGVPLTTDLDFRADVLIDFSIPAAASGVASHCMRQQVALVLATTGLDEAQRQSAQEASATIPVLWSPNMSLAVNLTMKLAQIAAQALAGQAAGVDVEIIERHHRYKEDAPSGTAVKFGEIIAAVMGQTHHRHGRAGLVGPRAQEEIGYHAVRTGDNPGEHEVSFGLIGESLQLRVAATSRDAYAHGALAAAKFLHGKPAGMYTMNEVLGL